MCKCKSSDVKVQAEVNFNMNYISITQLKLQILPDASDNLEQFCNIYVEYTWFELESAKLHSLAWALKFSQGLLSE